MQEQNTDTILSIDVKLYGLYEQYTLQFSLYDMTVTNSNYLLRFIFIIYQKKDNFMNNIMHDMNRAIKNAKTIF